jgi:hypothetical protein
MSEPPTSPAASRVLVVDLNSTARVWALPPRGAARLVDAAPPGVDGARGVGAHGVGRRRRAAAERGGAGCRAEAEVYFGFGLHPALLAAAPRLRWVQSAAAGVRSLLSPGLLARGIVLTNAAGVMAIPMAEYALAGALHFLRGFDVAQAQQRAAHWDRAPWVDPGDAAGGFGGPREVGECRVLVVGVRGIGAAVAERFAALGATVVGCGAARGVAPPGSRGSWAPTTWTPSWGPPTSSCWPHPARRRPNGCWTRDGWGCSAPRRSS